MSIARRIAAGIVRQAVVHPFTFDELDASATALWPHHPEETEPPRWRLDAVEPRRQRPKPARLDRERKRRPTARVASTPWETPS
jgi:hypothetical protein